MYGVYVYCYICTEQARSTYAHNNVGIANECQGYARNKPNIFLSYRQNSLRDYFIFWVFCPLTPIYALHRRMPFFALYYSFSYILFFVSFLGFHHLQRSISMCNALFGFLALALYLLINFIGYLSHDYYLLFGHKSFFLFFSSSVIIRSIIAIVMISFDHWFHAVYFFYIIFEKKNSRYANSITIPIL